VLAVATLWQREIVRFLRQRSRVIGALVQPIVFWILLGGGLSASFRPPGAPDGRLEDGRGRREQGRQHGRLVGRVRRLVADARLLTAGQDLLRRRRGGCGQLRDQYYGDLLRRLAVHAGLDAAGGEPQIQQRGHHLPARAPQKLGQRVHPQLLGQVVEAG